MALLRQPVAATLLLLLAAAAAADLVLSQMAVPGCQSRCGEVEVPYPFGIGNDSRCFRDDGFQLTCNDTAYNPPKLFRGTYEILGIDLPQGLLRATINVAHNCFDTGGRALNTGITSASLTNSPYTFSSEYDRFYVTGCDTLAYMTDPAVRFATGCVSFCLNISSVKKGSCSGIGCCQTEIPRGVKSFEAQFTSFYNHTYVHSFNPCSYAFLADKEEFIFNTSILAADYTYQRVRVPTVLEFSVENQTCEEARDASFYACRSSNSDCLASKNGLGYICNCSLGYSGNPYLDGGCRDIDECRDKEKYPCGGICTNIPGGYNCTCPEGSYRDARKGTCSDAPNFSRRGNSLLGVLTIAAVGSLILLLFGLCLGYKKMKMIDLRQKFFEQNGGVILRNQIASNRATAFGIFTLAQLEKATGNFSRDSLLGEGGNGSVHKGQLKDGRVVAIKREKPSVAHASNAGKRKEFVGEMMILAGINHKNVVKLLGCCLEVDVPMLVYEYIPNNTLSHYIHGVQTVTLSDCLRLATEAAKALAYLHDEIEPAIVHGDVKSSNILLGEKYNVKVADFGTSNFVEEDAAEATRSLKGTPGYWDPESFRTGRVTEKSDVYSYGIVLMELLTRRRNVGALRDDFIRCADGGRLEEVVSFGYLDWTGRPPVQLAEASKLAVRCVAEHGVDRPSMVEVVIALETIRKSMATASAGGGPSCQIPTTIVSVEPFNDPQYMNDTHTTFYSLEIEDVPILNAN